MYQPKPLTKEGVHAALQKAERYRLLNEPWDAESICRDVLDVDPDNQPALIALLLSLTDQFGHERGGDVQAARDLLPQLTEEYHRFYYAGIICERRGKTFLRAAALGTGPIVYEWLREAMDWYEKAETIRPAGDDGAILRWNACARIILKHDNVRPVQADDVAPIELE